MLSNTKLGIIIALAILVVAVIGLKQAKDQGAGGINAGQTPVAETPVQKPVTTGNENQAPAMVKPPDAAPLEQPQAQKSSSKKLPRLVDLGRGTCIPCKKMAPILDELTKEYKGRMQVEVIDLRYKPDAAKEYKIKVIPTQIFYDASGRELYRHQGFMSKEDILAKWEELGFVFSK